MTNTFLDITGLSHFYEKLKEVFLKSSDVKAASGEHIATSGTPTVTYSNGTFTFDYLKGESGSSDFSEVNSMLETLITELGGTVPTEE